MHGKKRSPFRDEKKGMSNMAYNALQMEVIRQTEKEIGPPTKPGGWSLADKNKLQRSISNLKTVRKKYPIKDYSHKKDEYKVK